MAVRETNAGQPGRAFRGRAGDTLDAGALAADDRVLDGDRFASEGSWAFCRFTSDEVPAVRMGFQRGAFNIGRAGRRLDPDHLQLHLEIMTRDGGLLWLPSGRYPAASLRQDADGVHVRLEDDGKMILEIGGWPDMEWNLRSDGGETGIRLRCRMESATYLPDCILPHCVFCMWAATGRARAAVTYGGRTVEVEGWMFHDHPRIIHGPNEVTPRRMFLYTTLFLEDGSRLLGYHALDDAGRPFASCCFGVYAEPSRGGWYLPDARLISLDTDRDGIPVRWSFVWRSRDVTVEAEVRASPPVLDRIWGGDFMPKTRADLIALPLVTEGSAVITRNGRSHEQRGYGLSEYYDADHWEA